MHLRQLLRQHKPGILLLGRVRAEELFREIPYSGLERVDPVGFSGGIWLFGAIDLIAKSKKCGSEVTRLPDFFSCHGTLILGVKE